MGASFRNVGEITELAGCDYLTIAPKLLEELKNSSEPVPKKLDASKPDGEKMEKVSYLDDEAKFRWAMFEDTMAFDKLHEGIRGFAKDGTSPCVLSRVLLTSVRSDPQGHDQGQVLISSRRSKWIYCRRVIGRMHLCLSCCLLFRDLLRFPDKVHIHKVLQSTDAS
jgi:hypothetical protein